MSKSFWSYKKKPKPTAISILEKLYDEGVSAAKCYTNSYAMRDKCVKDALTELRKEINER